MTGSGQSTSSGDADIEGAAMARLGGHFLGEEFHQSLIRMYKTKIYSDVVLKVGDVEIKAHKFLLGSHCSYFQDLPEFKKQTTISLKKIDPDSLQLVLTYLFHGELEVPMDQVKPMMEVANALGIQSLLRQCTYVLLADQPLTPKNCLQIWMAAYDNNDHELCARAQAIALEHFPRLQHDPSFKQLPPTCIGDYLSHPDLRVLSQEDRLNACLNWVKADEDTRAVHLSRFLDVIPLHKMNDWFLEQVLSDSLIENQDKLEEKLQRVLDAQQGDGASCGDEDSDVGSQVVPIRDNPTVEVSKAKQTQTWMVTTGMQLYRDGKLQAPCEDIQAICLDGDDSVVNMARVGPGAKAAGVKLCTHDNKVFIAGLGDKYDEVWQCVVSSSSKLEHCHRWVLLICMQSNVCKF